MQLGRYVVIGASGILAPLGSRLAGPGVTTTGIARGSPPPAGSWDDWVSLDVRDVAAVTRWAGSTSPADVLVAYSPAVADDVWPLLRRVAGRLVVVATTEWADPAAPAPAWSGLADHVVQLGWAREGDESRWHTPEEISADLVDLLSRAERGGAAPADSTTFTLGAVRPWVQRPR